MEIRGFSKATLKFQSKQGTDSNLATDVRVSQELAKSKVKRVNDHNQDKPRDASQKRFQRKWVNKEKNV